MGTDGLAKIGKSPGVVRDVYTDWELPWPSAKGRTTAIPSPAGNIPPSTYLIAHGQAEAKSAGRNYPQSQLDDIPPWYSSQHPVCHHTARLVYHWCSGEEQPITQPNVCATAGPTVVAKVAYTRRTARSSHRWTCSKPFSDRSTMTLRLICETIHHGKYIINMYVISSTYTCSNDVSIIFISMDMGYSCGSAAKSVLMRSYALLVKRS